MSFPASFLDEIRSRVSLASYAERKLTFDRKKSQPGKGDYWACCPFHQEKSASFHIEDRKGFYYCFGCQEKGDLISFVQQVENVSFPEAVEILAREAGLEMPQRDARAAEREQKRKGLYEAMEAAVRFYQAQLREAQGAIDYLKGRGLTGQTALRFELGFAPNARDTLTRFLRGEGYEEAVLIEAGLSGKDEQSGALYDRFRDRIMFPIRDGRNRAIAFGGRAMRKDAKAKYLNSAETPLFHKGKTLYNLAPARGAAGRGSMLIVGEGYMDVIALVEAGFEAAVAPLGTAITEEQLRLLWRMSPEPVLALDGDAAGTRAAHKAAALALPLLEPGKSLRFAYLPDGQDPDDLLRAKGQEAVAAVFEQTVSLIDTLWKREIEAEELDTPERKAAFDQRLRTLIGQIRNPSVRGHYAAEIAQRRAALFGLSTGAASGGFLPEPPAPLTPVAPVMDAPPPDFDPGYGEGPPLDADFVPDYGPPADAEFGPAPQADPGSGGSPSPPLAPLPPLPPKAPGKHGGGRFPAQSGGFRGGGSKSRGFGRGGWRGEPPGASEETRRSALAQSAARNRGDELDTDVARDRESVLLGALLLHPALILDFETEIGALDFLCPDLDAARVALLTDLPDALGQMTAGDDTQDETPPPDPRIAAAQILDEAFGAGSAERVLGAARPLLPRASGAQADHDAARAVFEEMLHHYASELIWLREAEECAQELARDILEHAERESVDDPQSEAAPGSLQRLSETMRQTRMRQGNQDAAFSEQEDELSVRLQSFVDAKPWIKKRS
ncbi:MAG: DNA primase [Neomegalonema sp.]|nr:DNA primase [Neomegalonema sp.]